MVIKFGGCRVRLEPEPRKFHFALCLTMNDLFHKNTKF